LGRAAFTEAQATFLESPRAQLGIGFLESSFKDALGGSFGEEFANRFRTSQSIRGFSGGGGGGSGAAQEATFLARLADQRRRELLPMLTMFDLQAQQAGQAAFNREAAFAQTMAGLPISTGDPIGAALTGAVQGGLGGLLIGNQLQNKGQNRPTTQAENTAGVSAAVNQASGGQSRENLMQFLDQVINLNPGFGQGFGQGFGRG
jgi:hypothetical protein